jgi:hypothetical protein
VDEVGVYYGSADKWIDIPPEVVNWQSGGVVKHLVSVGLIKENINAKLRHGMSHTRLSLPTELLVYAPEGVAITEYQLIKLHAHSNSREFRTLTGSVFHVSGGPDRNTIGFTAQHIAQRTWTIDLWRLEPGDYGLMPPRFSTWEGLQLGKMYTFSITGTTDTVLPRPTASPANGIQSIFAAQNE